MISAEDIIRTLDLKPADEGGFYRETYRSEEKVLRKSLPKRYRASKSIATAIYYLLTPGARSRLHRLPTDEIYHFYLGDPVTMLQLHPGGKAESITLGHEIDKGEQVQVTVPRDTWQGSFLKEGGRFALLGTTMAPGFDTSDYEAGDRTFLIQRYPDEKELTTRLT
jgi:predicted cupin superfamily sugar epimerase